MDLARELEVLTGEPAMDALVAAARERLARLGAAPGPVSGETGELALRLVVVDDNPVFQSLVTEVARAVGFVAEAVGSIGALKRALTQHHTHAIVLDLALGTEDGVEVLRFLSHQRSHAQIVLASAFEERVLRATARLGQSLGLRIAGSLHKPLDVADLREMLTRVAAAASPDETAPITRDELAHAIAQRELAVYYQPKLTIADRRAVGAEALVRWDSPRRGLVQPGDFVALAERFGLVDALTERVLDEATRDCASWRRDGKALGIAVNVSPISLANLSFPETVTGALERNGLPAEALTLEVTETAAMSDTRAITDVLVRLRIRGIQLAIDDFGTGHSSLVQLLRMPFGELKIDQSFVIDSSRDADAATIVETVVALGRNLHMKVVAEGVETIDQWDLLHRLGCDLAQGHLVGRAMTDGEFRRWIEAR